MRGSRRFLPLAGLLGVAGVSVATALAASVSWGSAIEVPGIASLNAGGNAGVVSVSCPGAGTCTAGGYYSDGLGGSGLQAFVADETGGAWGNAIEVPGTAALNVVGDASVISVSCPSAGNCAAGGYFRNGSFNTNAFLVDEKNGVWGNAGQVPGITGLDAGSTSEVSSISCASAGNCAAGGRYYANGFHAWVATEKNGVWGNAIEVPGTPALRGNGSGAYTDLNSISCGSPGNCAAGGQYYDGQFRAWVATETKGVWQNAKQVPGTAALNVGGHAQVNSVSCVTASFCEAGGVYTDATSNTQAFVVGSNQHGVWGKAHVLPGTPAALKTAGFANLTSLSCASPGNCSAGGDETTPDGDQAFVASSKMGTWSKAKEVPGIAALDNNSGSKVLSISCAGAGNCAATGYDNANPFAFIVGEKKGVWGTAVTLPGIANIGTVDGTTPVSCAKAGRCAVGGGYYNGSNFQAFITAP